jgi:hypothetical protein
LSTGDTVTLLGVGASHGYKRVTTASGDTGWVYQGGLRLLPVATSDGTTTAVDSAAAGIDPSWDTPAPVDAAIAGCPAKGDPTGDTLTDALKDRVDEPANFHPVGFNAIAQLS